MSQNTKQRSQEIYAVAAAAVQAAGGPAKIDRMLPDDRIATLHRLYDDVALAASCHRDTAKRNIAKALRKGRYAEMVANWGGPREGSGYPKGKPRK